MRRWTGGQTIKLRHSPAITGAVVWDFVSVIAICSSSELAQAGVEKAKRRNSAISSGGTRHGRISQPRWLKRSCGRSDRALVHEA